MSMGWQYGTFTTVKHFFEVTGLIHTLRSEISVYRREKLVRAARERLQRRARPSVPQRSPLNGKAAERTPCPRRPCDQVYVLCKVHELAKPC